MPRVLVVDDDRVQLELRRVVLTAEGYQVLLAATPSQAIEQLRQGCDLLMMDLRFLNSSGMPDAREGLALIRKIRAIDSRVPILVLSGWPDDIEGSPEQKMVSQVMPKPVPTRVLLAALAALRRGKGSVPGD